MATVIINDTTPRVKYTANGSTTRFDFDFVCFQTADLVVYVGDTVAETGFTITHDPTTLKGYVTFATAPAAGTGITLVRRMAYDQKVDFTQVALLKRDPLHNEFSRVFAMIQQINEAIGRSVTVDVYSDATPAELTGMIEDLWAIKDDMTTDAANIAAITTTAGSIANVNTTAANISDVNTVAGIAADVSAVAAIDDDVSDVADDLTNIDAVAGDLTNINAVSGDLTNIDAVSAALTNVGTVAGSIANVNAVGADIANVNAVSADLTNIDTAATNISDINTAAANIAAIIAAPNQASAAAASAALAEDWASKTDGPVEGSEYSAKWYALNTDASGKADKDLSNLTATGENHFVNPALTNSPYTTNRILEIPQDIKLELNNGTLTLKAGSKVYAPNGFESDGTTPKFDVVTIENDVSTFYAGVGRGLCVACYIPSQNTLGWYELSVVGSGSTVGSYKIFYNTATNKVVFPDEGYETSLPVSIIYESNGSGITSINQVFNGFGYIGSTVFALPMKGEATTAINQDGTVTKTIWESTTVQTLTVSASGVYSMSSSGVLTAGFNEVGYTKLADVIYYGSRIQDVKFYGVGFVANSNASNFSQAGRSYLSGLGMPSSKYEDWTLGASGTIYTAPANGYLFFSESSTAAGQYVAMIKTYFGEADTAAFPSELLIVGIPLLKGESVTVYYSTAGSTDYFRFFYVEGEK